MTYTIATTTTTTTSGTELQLTPNSQYTEASSLTSTQSEQITVVSLKKMNGDGYDDTYEQVHGTINRTYTAEDNDSYMASSILTASPYPYPDATANVHEMHLALLYLLSNPEEFQKAMEQSSSHNNSNNHRHHYTLSEWNQDYHTDAGSTMGGTTVAESPSLESGVPLPFVVFCDDAEVVLPQAHTASQLFGVERLEGIELEAAAGIHSLSQLFLRWLALMPGGDHLNIIDPPGLTVMRIAGGRYRVTAAHRVVWTWMNEFAELEVEPSDICLAANNSNDENGGDHITMTKTTATKSKDPLQVGDLVTMTIVDVFETDNNGKLLSYCPTFDNRDIQKTTAAAETIRKSSTRMMHQLHSVANSETANKLNEIAKRGLTAGFTAARSIAHQVMNERFSPKRVEAIEKAESTTPSMTAQDFEHVMTKGEKQATRESFIYEEEDDDDESDGPREI